MHDLNWLSLLMSQRILAQLAEPFMQAAQNAVCVSGC